MNIRFFSTQLIAVLLIILIIVASCAVTRSKTDTPLNHSISRIENNIIPIDEAGNESGKPQSVLARMKELNIPGMSIAVFDEGKIIWAKAYGISDKELLQKVDTSTIFQAASISKPLTSVAVFKMAEDSLILLDKDINLQLKSWKLPENDFVSEKKVTPRRIVSHMAGLTVHGFYGYSITDPIPSIYNILDGVSPANSAPVRVFAVPDAKESYSGGGFMILQLLLEEVSNKPFAALMNDLIIKPAGMNKSAFSLKVPKGMEGNFAKGYRLNGEEMKGGYHLYPEQAAAGLWTTPSDLARFMLHIGDSYRGYSGKKILQPATVKMMLTRVPGGGGQGFGIDGTGEAFRFRHNGGNEGYRCYAVSFAEKGRGMVVMTNSDNGNKIIREIGRAISREYQWHSLWNKE